VSEIKVELQPETAEIVQVQIQRASTAWKVQRFKATVHNDPVWDNGVEFAMVQGGGDITKINSLEADFIPPKELWPNAGKSTISATSKTDKTKVAFATITY
jgi:hypothetical protein